MFNVAEEAPSNWQWSPGDHIRTTQWKTANHNGRCTSGSCPPSCLVRLHYASLPLELTYSSESSGADRLALTPFLMIHSLAAVITALRASYQFPFPSLLPSALVLQAYKEDLTSDASTWQLRYVCFSPGQLTLSYVRHFWVAFLIGLFHGNLNNPVPLQNALKCLSRALHTNYLLAGPF